MALADRLGETRAGCEPALFLAVLAQLYGAVLPVLDGSLETPMRFKVTLALRKEIEVCAPTAAPR